jgi:hypothetical protein
VIVDHCKHDLRISGRFRTCAGAKCRSTAYANHQKEREGKAKV